MRTPTTTTAIKTTILIKKITAKIYILAVEVLSLEQRALSYLAGRRT